jgi:hypothetical protein
MALRLLQEALGFRNPAKRLNRRLIEAGLAGQGQPQRQALR